MKTLTFAAAGASLAIAGLAAAPQVALAQGAPQGSYAQTCSNAYVNQGRLYAQCLDTSSRSRSSSISLSACANSDIGNDNGLLVCHNVRGQWETNGGGNNNGGWNGGGNNGGGWNGGGNSGWNGGNNGGWNGGNNGGGWNGGGRQSITVYSDSNYRGQSQTFRGEIYNLNGTGLNDQISSIQLYGPWELCSDSNFRGDCQVFEDDQRNLNYTTLNDRISSMRPARRW